MNALAAARAPQGRALIAFVVTTLAWGSTWLVIKGQLGAVPPAWSVTWRFALAAVGMFALAAATGQKLRLKGPVLRYAALTGMFQFFLNFQFVYQSERYVTSGLVAVLFALMLVPNALLGRIFFKSPLSVRFLAGSALALGGIALLLLHEYRSAPAGAQAVLIGAGFAGLSILCASIGNVLQAAPALRAVPGFVLLAWAMLFGTLGNALYALVTSGPPQIEWSAAYLGGVAYLGLVGSVLTFPLYLFLLREWGPGRAGYNAVAIPVVAMAMSTLFEGYRWTGLAAAGAVLAMLGMLIALSGRK